MPRAIWKGAISFGLVHIPVELYPAESQKGLDLDMLDRRDFAPVGYKRYNKETGKDIDWNDIFAELEFLPGTTLMMEISSRYRAEQPGCLERARALMAINAGVDAAAAE